VHSMLEHDDRRALLRHDDIASRDRTCRTRGAGLASMILGGIVLGLPILILLLVVSGLAVGAVRLSARRRGRPERGQSIRLETTPEVARVADREVLTPADSGRAARLPALPPMSPLQTPAGGWAVETHGLTKRFGPNVAVDDVELLVPRGCAFGYLGPNGAGKTTLIRTLLGLTHADGGTMSLLGIGVPAERSKALGRVGAIVDEPRFYGHLTGRENLRVLAAARGGGAGLRIGSALTRVRLADRADDKVASYSMGMRQRLGVAACLLADPELLILDEPMNGLDPAGMHEMREMIRAFVAEGRTVMLSSHLLDEVERTCDAVAIVDRGRVVRQGSIDDLVRGRGTVVQVDCSDPAGAARLIDASTIAAEMTIGDGSLTLTLAPAATREVVAEINRRIVDGGISVYGLGEVRTTLEDWFLSVTTRLGDTP